MTIKVKVVTPKRFVPSISKTAGDSDFAAMENLSDMGHGESRGHVTDDVTWPRKVKVVTLLCLMSIISKTAGDTDFVAMEYQ